MLKIVRLSPVFVLATALLFVIPPPAHADPWGDTKCSDTSQPGCDVGAGTTGDSGGQQTTSGGGQSGDGKCHDPAGTVIPCERDGAWAGTDGCYYKPLDLSADTIAALGGQPAGEGGWYERTCYGNGNAVSSVVWVPGPPPVVSPEVLAREARSRLNLPDVVIELSPGGDQLVNLPTWLALAASSWQSQSATAAVPGVSVTATARAVSATWLLGDGSTVVCHGPGTRWTAGTDPSAASPDCGHTYTRSSAGQPGSAFRVTVTVTWEVTWVGAGQSGVVPGLTTTGGAQVRVAESQAVIRG